MDNESKVRWLPDDVQRKFDDKLKQMSVMVKDDCDPVDAKIAAVHYFSIMDPIASLQVLRDFITRNLDPEWTNAIKKLSP